MNEVHIYLANDSPSFTPVHPQIRAIGPRDLHLWKGRGPGDHPAQQYQVTLVADKAVLTQEAGELSMEPGVGNHWALVWCDNPNVS